MKKIFVPANCICDWQKLLAKPNKQWEKGYSAYETAISWQNSNGFPKSVSKVFNQSPFKTFHDIELIFAFPEYQVVLDTNKRPSQNDIFIIAKGNGELISITVEGKVEEPFDKYIKDWDNGSLGKKNRLLFLKKELNLPLNNVDNIRYQLLHRTVSSLIMAKKLNAPNALMLVNSFSKSIPVTSFNDYAEFVKLYGITPKQDEICYIGNNFNGISLYLGWVNG